jgi:hypothetical protein
MLIRNFAVGFEALPAKSNDWARACQMPSDGGGALHVQLPDAVQLSESALRTWVAPVKTFV